METKEHSTLDKDYLYPFDLPIEHLRNLSTNPFEKYTVERISRTELLINTLTLSLADSEAKRGILISENREQAEKIDKELNRNHRLLLARVLRNEIIEGLEKDAKIQEKEIELMVLSIANYKDTVAEHLKEIEILRRVVAKLDAATVDYIEKDIYDLRIVAPALAELHKFDTEKRTP